MQALLIGLLLLVAILIAGRFYANASPVLMAKLVRRVGGTLALSAAASLLFTGKGLLALPLAALGWWLLGQRMPWQGPDDAWTQTGQRSSVRTAMLEMTTTAARPRAGC
jgi:hypothetical protein